MRRGSLRAGDDSASPADKLDGKAAKAALAAFDEAANACLEGLLHRINHPNAEERRRDPLEHLVALFDHGKTLMHEAGEALSETDMGLQRAALKAQAAAHQLKLQTQRQASNVSLQCQKAEIEFTYEKKFEEKVKELVEHGEGSLLQEALQKERTLRDLRKDLTRFRRQALAPEIHFIP